MSTLIANTIKPRSGDTVTINSTGINITGVSTFSANIDANAGLDVDGHTELDDLNVAGVSTFVGDATFSGDVIAGGDPNSAVNIGAKIQNEGIVQVCRAGTDTLFVGSLHSSGATSTINAAGDATFETGTFAGSVKIGGTAAANEIDAYEESTWTPTFHGTLNSGVWAATGTYTKIGNTVTIQMKQTGGDVSWSLGTWIVGGLPFTPGADCAAGSMTDTGPSFGGIVSLQGSTRIYAATAASNITTLRITATYIV